MSIVELDLVFGSELRPIVLVVLFVSSDDVTDGSTAEEVLLFQTQFFSSLCGVIRVENTGDVLSALSLGDSSKVVSLVE